MCFMLCISLCTVAVMVNELLRVSAMLVCETGGELVCGGGGRRMRRMRQMCRMRRCAVRMVRFLLCVWKCESPGEAGWRLWGEEGMDDGVERREQVGDESSEGGEGDREGE